MEYGNIITQKILVCIFNGYVLNPIGTHGISHWGRVLENGLRLAEMNGADPVVVTYFALFHDSRRINEHIDYGHGKRGAELFLELSAEISVSENQRAEIVEACSHHTDGTTEGSITVQTCWDADRLDLWRVGKKPRKSLICTESAKVDSILEWSRNRSENREFPSCSNDWLRLLK
jgi:uncharacterized protein